MQSSPSPSYKVRRRVLETVCSSAVTLDTVAAGGEVMGADTWLVSLWQLRAPRLRLRRFPPRCSWPGGWEVCVSAGVFPGRLKQQNNAAAVVTDR